MLAGGGKVWWSEHRLRRANGSYTHVYDRASVIYDAAHKPLRMVGVTLDETRRKQAEEKIREQAALLDKAQDAIILCTPDGLILFWNRGARRIYGWAAEEVIGKKIRQLLFGDDQPAIGRNRQEHRTNREVDGELHQFTKDDEPSSSKPATLIRDEQGRPNRSSLSIPTSPSANNWRSNFSAPSASKASARSWAASPTI